MLKLVKAHFHKDKAVLTAFLLILIVAAMLLQTGFMVGRFDSLYDERARQRNISDAMYFCYGNEEEIKRLVNGMDHIGSFYLVDLIRPDVITYSVDSGKEKDIEGLFFLDEEAAETYQKLSYIEKDESITGPWIDINVYTAYSEGMRVGDKVTIKDSDLGEYEFTVAGIYEDLFCGQRYSYYSTVIDHDSYEMMSAKADSVASEYSMPHSMQFLCVSFKDGNDIALSTTKTQDILTKEGIYCNGYNRILAKTGYVGITNIIAAFMTSFSAVIAVIALIMIIFTVNTNINRDIRNIGALRAVGFTISQVRMSLMIEYSVIAAVAGATGIALAYLAFPLLEEYATKQLSGLVWDGGFIPVISLPIFAGFILVMILVTFAATHLIRNIHPATALRFGLESHSFTNNHLPLDKTKGNLNILLALKSMFQNKGQNIIVIGVILAVSFMTAFSAILFYNTRIDITNFQRLLQGDAPDAYVNITYESADEMYGIIEKLQAMDEVSEAYGLASNDAHASEYNCYLLYSNHPEFVYCGVYEGQMAMEANEAVVGSLLAERLGLGIGDEIRIKYLDDEETFLITGLQQAVYSMGERIYISDDGFRRFGGDPVYTYVRVRLHDASESNVDAFLEHAKTVLGDNCTSTENYYHTQRSTENIPVYAVALVILVLIVLNIFTVLIVIRLLLKTVFIKREKEFGIKKAVGFTSRQLRVQLSLSLIPLSITGSILGSIAACLTTNRLFDLIFSSYGIKNSNLIINPAVIPVALAIVVLMVFVISFVMSGRMKKVSAYKLIAE
ncbi:MAG: FtsX-like permease family protein [Saccharofermentans sp.]|nr:FtsX-like permease family protein [Saccharofermentans sp.]